MSRLRSIYLIMHLRDLQLDAAFSRLQAWLAYLPHCGAPGTGALRMRPSHLQLRLPSGILLGGYRRD
ncbi:unnamed protein product, partial [Ascophyllum nodosum]